jgi:iron complex outermembrane recepter protein
MLKSFMIVALATMSLSASAQFTLSGAVRDSKTNAALVGASITLVGAQKFTASEAEGLFNLTGLSPGAITLSVTFVGYKEKILDVQLTSSTTLDVLLEEQAQLTDEVVVTATRAAEKSPTSFSTLDKSAIQKQNFGQDVPFLLNWTPSVVTTSDAGAGVGYTGVRIRGSDATRVNVTINGIPYNDSESQGTFWVNLPDIASSTQSIQIQRGVGTSTNGAGAFGGSINLQTNTRNDRPYADIINSYGSFNTQRHTLGVGSGLINNKITLDARVSLIKSDGFIDRASSNLKSYYFTAGYYGKKSILKAIVFGGNEVTYQSWWGVPQSRLNNDANAMLETAAAEDWNEAQKANLLTSDSRTFNTYTYKNQVDNYSQDHFQLHFSHQFDPHLSANAALHYTYGRGYFEEFKYNDSYLKYGLDTVLVGGQKIGSGDLVRRRWLRNDFYGITYSLKYENAKITSLIGGGLNRYDGDHFGEVISAVGIKTPFQYYFNNGKKTDFNIYWKNTVQLIDNLSAFVDLQYRGINYSAKGREDVDFSVGASYHFFNPKVGLNYERSDNDFFYASFSVANREPVRDDFVNAVNNQQPKPEGLQNLELGWKWKTSSLQLNINYYRMDYKNQLVLTGKLNDVGNAIRANVDKSFRQGIELDGSTKITSKLNVGANITLSENKIKNFTEVIYDYGENFDEYKADERNYSNQDISFSPSVIAGSSVGYSILKGLDATLLAKYVGKQYLDNTSNESRKIDSYFVNDVRISYAIHPKHVREISFSILLNNVLDVKYSSNGYTWGYLAGSTETRQNYYYPQAGKNYLAMLTIRL